MRAVRALTCDDLTVIRSSPLGGVVETNETVTAPLLTRSISYELRQIESELGAKGKTRLYPIAVAIDEALLALQEALGYGEAWSPSSGKVSD